nr:MAG TPA: hypothetical protein [Caudoviricetes sp.]
MVNPTPLIVSTRIVCVFYITFRVIFYHSRSIVECKIFIFLSLFI